MGECAVCVGFYRCHRPGTAPMLIDQLEYLYYMTISADQRPGDDAYSRFEVLRKELEKYQSDWEQMKEGEGLD